MTDLIKREFADATFTPLPDNTPAEQRHYKIGRKLNAALVEYVANGAHITKAAQHAGMSREALSRALQKQHVQERVASLLNEFKQRSGVKALVRLDHLIDANGVSPYVQLEAAKTMADRAGHAPPKGDGVADTTLIVNIRLD